MTIGRIIDVSSDQHPDNAPIDWARVAGAGVTAVFIKATQGTDYTNPYWKADLVGARNAGLGVVAYHFADMGDAIAEAAHFLAVAGPWARMLDFETNTQVQWARSFLLELRLGAAELITYGSASSLKDFYAQLPSMAFPAAYDQGWPGWGTCWQFTDSAVIDGIRGLCDEDQWRGDETQYETLFQLLDPPEHGGEDKVTDSVKLDNGDVVSHVVRADGHYLEVTRKAGTAGTAVNPPGEPENVSVIDMTLALPTVVGTVQP